MNVTVDEGGQPVPLLAIGTTASMASRLGEPFDHVAGTSTARCGAIVIVQPPTLATAPALGIRTVARPLHVVLMDHWPFAAFVWAATGMPLLVTQSGHSGGLIVSTTGSPTFLPASGTPPRKLELAQVTAPGPTENRTCVPDITLAVKEVPAGLTVTVVSCGHVWPNAGPAPSKIPAAIKTPAGLPISLHRAPVLLSATTSMFSFISMPPKSSITDGDRGLTIVETRVELRQP